MNVGDMVVPKTCAGVWLGDVPVNGEFEQMRIPVCVFRGVGAVVAVSDCVIDYDKWDSESKVLIGKVDYRNCLVKCDNGAGWAGAGALILANKP